MKNITEYPLYVQGYAHLVRRGMPLSKAIRNSSICQYTLAEAVRAIGPTHTWTNGAYVKKNIWVRRCR